MNVKPRQTFYRVASIGNSDGTLDAENMMEDCYESLDEALEQATGDTNHNGVAMVVYECRPLYITRRGRVRVTKVR